ncbi:MAG TPA: hypothetical protein VD931_16325, partial [Baekduia sp.]|nr:hypothetical protein [Baekduia sp.]
EGGVRNPSANETQALTRETEIIANTSTYGTRQSNKSDNGGGAIYGCRSGAGGTAAKNEPCVRANNLSSGLAFEFESDGNLIGTFTVAKPGDEARPFTTNATGVATGLNADRVDGADLAEIVKASTPRWALVNEQGQIEAQSGGFRVVTAYPGGADQNVYLDTGEDVRTRGLTATIAFGPNPNGEVAAGACGLETVTCAANGTENANTIVVSPRLSNGDATAADSRRRFYVTVTR